MKWVARGCRLPAILLLSAPVFAAAESDPVTAENWYGHPMTRQIRAIYQTVEDGLASGRLAPDRRAFAYCVPYVDTVRIAGRAADGRIRKYYTEAGSDDSAIKVSHYYDDRGALRFAFVRAGAANGTVLEYRLYFDEAGVRFWHDRRHVAGPGYTFPDLWPEENLVREPGAAFAAENGCPRGE